METTSFGLNPCRCLKWVVLVKSEPKFTSLDGDRWWQLPVDSWLLAPVPHLNWVSFLTFTWILFPIKTETFGPCFTQTVPIRRTLGGGAIHFNLALYSQSISRQWPEPFTESRRDEQLARHQNRPDPSRPITSDTGGMTPVERPDHSPIGPGDL